MFYAAADALSCAKSSSMVEQNLSTDVKLQFSLTPGCGCAEEVLRMSHPIPLAVARPDVLGVCFAVSSSHWCQDGIYSLKIWDTLLLFDLGLIC